jgi:predicted dehydrogenase
MRIGLVGYGFGGRTFHAPLLASLPQATFAGVVTNAPERRQQLAADYPGVPAFASLAQMLQEGIDLVVISTPLAGRAALIRQAIDEGVAVVSDKPFAVDAEEASGLIEYARQRGVALTVYQNRRWDSDFLTVRQLIDSGRLGTVSRFESRVERYLPASLANASGGGMLRDLGTHLVDQALTLFGPARQVYAELFYGAEAPDLDYGFFVALTHANGVVSHLSSSKLQSAGPQRMRVTGSAGTYTVDGFDGQEAALIAGRTPLGEGERWGVEEHRHWGCLEQGSERAKVRSEHGDWLQFYRQVQAALTQGAALPVSAEQALLTVRTLDAARASFEGGRVVHLQADGRPVTE